MIYIYFLISLTIFVNNIFTSENYNSNKYLQCRSKKQLEKHIRALEQKELTPRKKSVYQNLLVQHKEFKAKIKSLND